jgi:hypothetical protein
LDIKEIIGRLDLARVNTLINDVDILRFIAEQEEILRNAEKGVVSRETEALIRSVKPTLKKYLRIIARIEDVLKQRQ